MPELRKPAARMEPRPAPVPVGDWAESGIPRSIRMTPSLWDLFAESARRRGVAEISAFVRECARIGLKYLDIEEAHAEHSRPTSYDARHTSRRTGV